VIPPQGAEQKLTPGTVAFWNQEKGKVTLETLNTEPYSAWHRHRFVFDNVSLGEMMETLSLWYDVEVRFKDTHLADLHFSGNISRYEQIDVVLRAIESTVDIHCQLQGHRIEIEPNR
jgi:ferric-dicitrate binding protein FerR (iron transport regulator)